MIKRIFINAILCPAAIAFLLHPFLTESGELHLTTTLIGIALIIANINWCRKHLWHKPTNSATNSHTIENISIYGADDITIPEIGNTLKRGVDLHK